MNPTPIAITSMADFVSFKEYHSLEAKNFRSANVVFNKREEEALKERNLHLFFLELYVCRGVRVGIDPVDTLLLFSGITPQEIIEVLHTAGFEVKPLLEKRILSKTDMKTHLWKPFGK